MTEIIGVTILSTAGVTLLATYAWVLWKHPEWINDDGPDQ